MVRMLNLYRKENTRVTKFPVRVLKLYYDKFFNGIVWKMWLCLVDKLKMSAWIISGTPGKKLFFHTAKLRVFLITQLSTNAECSKSK